MCSQGCNPLGDRLKLKCTQVKALVALVVPAASITGTGHHRGAPPGFAFTGGALNVD
jgi:hypothetical protein